MSLYTEFWEWFLDNEEVIFNNIEQDTDKIVCDINERIKLVNNELEFEITLEVEDGKRNLIISADGVESIFNDVISFCEEAPDLRYWRVTSFRPRLNQKNQIIDMDGICLDYNDVYFQYSSNDDTIDINIYISGYDNDDNRYIHIYFLLLDSLIGEYDAVKMIKNTTIYPLEDSLMENLLPFRNLLLIIDNLKDFGLEN